MEQDMNKYIAELEFGEALCELNVYHNAMASGVPPYKSEEELQELKDKVRNFVKE